ncbi:primosomal replication protein [Enterovibrio makurazakiensis]|uniref:Primosomal replication protein n=1 Tax=Enterovibrio gelatinilyticus TaxID=2899819 RepID=A0ABT5QYA2_9GAMM|nr:primosomal replication protein [Enterovibrio sp. ZSDZ42]MDD1792998.1 primosomal replication protein [Enterovibrio sp. ZSDZ42]
MDLSPIKEQLHALGLQAAEIDRRRGEGIKPLFDERLFNCLARLLTPCVAESKSVVDTLEREQSSGKLSAMRAEHLCERLVNQVSALQREIATVSIRQKERSFAPKFGTSTGQLYQELAQHQEWERRLADMVRDAESNMAHSQTIAQQQHAQKSLLVAESRLARCRESKKKIEARITFREKKG